MYVNFKFPFSAKLEFTGQPAIPPYFSAKYGEGDPGEPEEVAVTGFFEDEDGNSFPITAEVEAVLSGFFLKIIKEKM